LAGALFAACAYAHPAGRVAVVIPLLHQVAVGLSAVVRLARSDDARRGAAGSRAGLRRSARAAGFAGAYLLLILPLASYFTAHPDQFLSRLGRAQALEGDDPAEAARDLAENAWRLALTPTVRGDNQWSHNLPGRPLLTGLGALGLWVALAGAVVAGVSALGRRRRPRGPPWSPLDPTGRLVLACWAIVMLLPAWLSGSGRDFARAGGALPAVMIAAGLGLDLVAVGGAQLWSRRVPPTSAARGGGHGSLRLGLALVALTLFAGALSTTLAYARYARAPEVAAIFQGRLTDQSERIAELARDATVFVPPAFTERAVSRYLTAGRAVLPMAPASGLALPLAAGRPVVYAGPAVGEGAEAVATLLARWPAAGWPAALATTEVAADGAPLLLTRRLPPMAEPTAVLGWPGMRDVGWRLVNGIRLAAARVDLSAGDQAVVDLAWWADQPVAADRTVFVHLRDAAGKTLAQADAMPWDNALPTSRWPVRTLFVDRHVVPLDPAQRDEVEAAVIGLYDLGTGQRDVDATGGNEWALPVGTPPAGSSSTGSGP
jgi:hypothetical protein